MTQAQLASESAVAGTAVPEGATTYMISSDCMGCGICGPMCPLDAIVEARNQLVILKRMCDGCGRCTPYCPVQAIVPKERFKERQALSFNDELRRILDQRA